MAGNTDSGDDPIEVMNDIEQLGQEWILLMRRFKRTCRLERSRVDNLLQLANHALILAVKAEVRAIGDTSQHPEVKKFIDLMNGMTNEDEGS